MIALAAVLWLVYLVPSWFRSRQYLATERNAVRLQQTLRILAETAEVPHEVRVEANARSIAEQERVLKHRAAVREHEAIPAAVRTADRIRRSRAVTALVLALSITVAVLGGVQAASTGTWIILAAGVIASVISFTMLVKLAKAGRRLRLPRPATRVSPTLVDHGDAFETAGADESVAIDEAELAEDTEDTGWVPVAVPRPAYLSRASARLRLADELDAAAADVTDETAGGAAVTGEHGGGLESDAAAHHESLRRAAAQAEAALRERLRVEHETVAELPAPAPAPTPVAERAVPSRFARMGIIEGDTAPHLDLDAVLARRRAG